MDFKDFYERFVVLAEYYDTPLKENIIAFYFENLKEFDIEDFDNACRLIVKNRKYSNLPKIADFIEAIEGGIDDKAIMAWDIAINATFKFSSYDSVRFSDEAINRAINSLNGGWEALCGADNESLKWLKQDFVKAYKAYKGKELEPSYLMGRSEIIGQDIPKIKLIHGDFKTNKCFEIGNIEQREFKAISAKVAPKIEQILLKVKGE